MKDNNPPIVNIQAVIAAAFSGLDSSASRGIVAWNGVYSQAPIPYTINTSKRKGLSANITEEKPPIPNTIPDANRKGFRRLNFRDKKPAVSTTISPHIGNTAVFALPSDNDMLCISK